MKNNEKTEQLDSRNVHKVNINLKKVKNNYKRNLCTDKDDKIE